MSAHFLSTFPKVVFGVVTLLSLIMLLKTSNLALLAVTTSDEKHTGTADGASHNVTRVFVMPEDQDDSELGHFLLPGIRQSPLLERVMSPLLSDVWIVEMGAIGETWCDDVTQRANATIADYSTASTTIPGWNIHIFDWADWPFIQMCEPLAHVVGIHNVYYHKRSIVSDRRVSSDASEIYQGSLQTYPDWMKYTGRPIKHFPYAVRPDTLAMIDKIVNDMNVTSDPAGNDVDLAARDRPMDVSHFWSPEDFGSNLRNAVNKELHRLNASHAFPAQAFAGMAGTQGEAGRQNASRDYVKGMLQSKIVIVCQRDGHEDHYRLMEALVSGAMVMTDVMLSLPWGLRHGESIVLFSSLREMRDEILFYVENEEARVQIARAGHKVALERHSPWRRMEDVILNADPPKEIRGNQLA